MRYLLFLALCFVVFSCKDNSKKATETLTEEPENTVHIFQNPSIENSQLPRLFSDDNHLFMSWVTRADSLDVLNYSEFSEDTWSDSNTIASGADWFTNWADFPAIANNNGNILANYLQKSATGTYTYDVKLSLYSNEKQQWKNNFILHDDGTQSEHGFVSILPFKEQDFFVTWLDGRNTAGGHESHDAHGSGGAMTLRGAFVSSEGDIYGDLQLDERVCDCCQTGAAMTASGPVVVYRDRSEAEVRDISIVRYVENEGWTSPQSVCKDNWKIEGCPVNGPSIDAIENDVVVAWFSEVKGTPKVQISFSEDGGATFGLPVRVDSNETLGRVGVVLLDPKTAAVCWLENKGDDTLIQVRSVESSGMLGDVMTISQTSSERASGFPQLALMDDTLVAAWTSISEGEQTQIKTAQIKVESL